MTPAKEAALRAALVELNNNFASAWNTAAANSFGFDAGARSSLDGSKLAIDLLKGPLLDACRGLRAWPLDEPGAGINEEGAYSAWLQLADSVRAALAGVKGYTGKWTALEVAKGVGGDVLSDAKSLLVVIAVVALAYVVFQVSR